MKSVVINLEALKALGIYPDGRFDNIDKDRYRITLRDPIYDLLIEKAGNTMTLSQTIIQSLRPPIVHSEALPEAG